MSISDAMSRPLRVVGRRTGKHALPRGAAQPARAAEQHDKPQHQPKHAASVPRQRTAA
jgi:hypothetical protein